MNDGFDSVVGQVLHVGQCRVDEGLGEVWNGVELLTQALARIA